MSTPAISADSALDGYLDVEERESVQIQRGNVWKLCEYIFKHRGLFFSGLFLIVLGTSAALVEPWLFGLAIDEAIVPKNWDLLRHFVLLYFFIILTRVGSTIGQAYLFENLGQRVGKDIRCQLFAHLQTLPVSIYDKNPAGRLLTRVTNDVASLNEMFSAGFASMIGNFLLVSGILISLVLMDYRLGMIAGSVFPVLAFASIHFSGQLRISYREARSKLSALNSFLAENMLGMKVVNLFNRQELHLARFRHINQWYSEAQRGTIRVFAYFQPSITWTAGLSMALVIWFGGKASWEGTLKLGILFAYFSYVMSLFQPVREMADKWNIFLSGMTSAERVFSILAWKPEQGATLDCNEAHPISSLRGEIIFENIWFAYEGENWVLKDFNLRVTPGSRVGIVGHTGAGKSTIISLFLRFYEPQKGRILLDGKDVRSYDKRELRASIGIIQQDVFLFSGTFKDNIAFWKEDDDLFPKVSAAIAHPVVQKSSDRRLEEHGSNLSMGERQVLAFARAFARDPKIWVLDEATANMDSESEKLLQGAFEKASQDRTTLLIAHRLATVRTADQILVLNKGVLVESGNHLELIQKDGLYSRLYRYQQIKEI